MNDVKSTFSDINLKLVGATKHAMENGIAMLVRRGQSGYRLSCEGNTQEGLLTSKMARS